MAAPHSTGIEETMRPHAKRRIVPAVVAVVVVVAILLFALPVFAASSPPKFEFVRVGELHATRTYVEASVAKNEKEPLLAKRIEFGQSEAGPWTSVAVAPDREEDQGELTHLTPKTTYYVRFFVEDRGGSATEILKVVTPSLEPPEIGEIRSPEIEGHNGGGFELGPTYVTFRAVEYKGTTRESNLVNETGRVPAGIETNGADTTYHFEYALPEAGHAPVESSGSWAPFTSGASGTITVAEESADPEAKLTGLVPETKYYVRLKAENGVGAPTVRVEPFETTPATPSAYAPEPFVSETSATSTSVHASVLTRGYRTEYRFEYTTEPGNAGSWVVVPGGTGTIPAVAPAELGASGLHLFTTATLTGLHSASSYYVRVHVENEPEAGVHKQATSPVSEAIETSGPPSVTTFAAHAVDGETMRALGSVVPGGAPVDELQSVTLGSGVTGGTFTLSFEGKSTGATGTGDITNGSREVTDLTTSTGAFIDGEQVSGAGIPVGTTVTEVNMLALKLSAPATASASGVALASGLAFDASAGVVEHALGALPNIGESAVGGEGSEVKPSVFVEGSNGGPYTIQFRGSKAGAVQPLLVANGSDLVPSGSGVTVVALQAGSDFPVHYHAEYVSQEQFEKPGGEGGFADAIVGSEVPGSGLVGVDLPGLQPGLTYRYRLDVSSEVAPHGVVGNEQSLSVPVPGPGEEPSCSNQGFRKGPAAVLPDCRAYEQVTPVEKEGAEDIFAYGVGTLGWLVGEDGDHFVLHAPGVNWGSSPDAETSNYFFSRNSETGWQMASSRPEHETGPDSYRPFLFDSDLTQIGLEVSWEMTTKSFSPDIELVTGPPGGPYTPVGAPIPRVDLENEHAWAGGSADGSKVIVQSEDHKLLGHATGTTSGDDLYEFSEGALRQVNIAPDGGKISTCGAKMVHGFEGYEGGHREWGENDASSPNAVSADGSRVFFYDNCTHDLYVRTNGTETTDIGEYVFLGADGTGSELLLEHDNNGTYEIFLYETATGGATWLTSLHASADSVSQGASGKFIVAAEKEKLTGFFMASMEQLTSEAPVVSSTYDLYDYDIATKTLRFIAVDEGNHGANGGGGYTVSPNGRYLYWTSVGVAGVPGGRLETQTHKYGLQQVYRYDSVESVVQCMSCASPYDPDPDEASLFLDSGVLQPADGLPNPTIASENGDFVFFDTYAPLVRQDVDGEDGEEEGGVPYSVSSDVYEWRKNGVDGCSHVQGCLALISSGAGGLEVKLLGTDASGSNVFFASHEPLVLQDQAISGNVYDARIGGGFPSAPPGPVECEADECSTPVSAPVDTTPASFTFSGVGNVVPSPAAKSVTKKKAKAKKKTKKKKKGKTVKRHGKAKKSSAKKPSKGIVSSGRSK